MSVDLEIYDPTHRLPQNPVLKREQQLVIKEERPSLAGVNVHLVQDMGSLEEFRRWLGERREVLACDTETTGFNPYEIGAKLRLVQFGDAMTGWSFPFEDWKGAVREVLTKYEEPIAFHNSPFDIRWIRVHMGWDVPWHRIHDTMIQAHIIDPTQSVALKNLGIRLVDRRAQAGEELLQKAFHDNKWDWATVPIDYPAYWAYAALDTVLTARLHETLRAWERYPRVYELEMATQRVTANMEDRGCRIDVDYCQQKYDELIAYVDRIKGWMKSEFGVANAGSNDQLVRFFQEQGAEITRFTPKGKPSCDKYQLRMLREDFPIAQTILDMRKADKLAKSYFANFLEGHVDGVLHATIRTLGARTSRMSMTKPALQTLPKGEATVRRAFIPDDEDDGLFSADYAQIEMRLMAHFSGDPELARAFQVADQTGGDFFVELGKQIYRAPDFTKVDKRRGLVKNTLYGAAYGAGVAKMAETAGVSFEVMKEVSDAVFGTYPGIRQFQDKVSQIAGEREHTEGYGYIFTPFGRRLPADPGKGYTLVNYLLQGHAAEILKEALVRLDMAGLGEYMLLPVHDEVIFSAPKKDAEELKRTIVECMQVTEGYAVALHSEAEGPLANWGEKYE